MRFLLLSLIPCIDRSELWGALELFAGEIASVLSRLKGR